MVSDFLEAGFVQLYGTPLAGKSYTLSKLSDLLYYSYERIVVVEPHGSHVIKRPEGISPERFQFCEQITLDAVADFALADKPNLLLIDDYDVYGTDAAARRINEGRINRLQRLYDKIIVTTTSMFTAPITGKVASYKVAHSADSKFEYPRLSRKGEHISVDNFILSLSRHLKLRHLA